jgi:hypothetical protein
MAKTKGRKFTDEELIAEARKYKTKRELKALDNSLLGMARRRGIPTSKLFEHMVDIPFSVPQLMCKLILETILEEECLYDTRQIIKPYELDIYFSKYKLAFEYCGDYWHQQTDAVKRDKIKRERCSQENITLIVLNMRSRRWEEDVKQQITEHLETINKITNKKIVPEDVLKIDCKDIYKNLPAIVDLDHVKEKIKECKGIKEFSTKFKREYRYLVNSGQLHLLDPLRTKAQYSDSNEDIIKLCLSILSYKDFVENHKGLYIKCFRLGILKEATKHMKKTVRPFDHHSNDELLALIPKGVKSASQLRKYSSRLYSELFKRKLLDHCGMSKSRKQTSRYDKTLEYFNSCIVPLIESGLTLNQIALKKLLPIRYHILKELTHVFASDKLLQKLKENKSQSYKNKKAKVVKN